MFTILWCLSLVLFVVVGVVWARVASRTREVEYRGIWWDAKASGGNIVVSNAPQIRTDRYNFVRSVDDGTAPPGTYKLVYTRPTGTSFPTIIQLTPTRTPVSQSIPIAIILIAAALLPSVRVGMAIRARARAQVARFRAATGLCPECGYDLRGSPAHCPECGAAGPAAARSFPLVP